MSDIEKKTVGRPSANATPITVRVSPEILAGIDQFCAEHDITRPEAVRMIIQDWMAKHQVIKGE